METNKILTIFTPTYNRIHTLERLYKSLCQQTNKGFCWLIVDDGSTDDTAKYVKNWIDENKVEIRYIYQENMGKSMAHNRGVAETTTELFTCVDSDDYLTDDAVEAIINSNLEKCVGIVFKKGEQNIILTKWNKNLKYSTLYNAYHYCDMSGDAMIVFKSGIIKKYCFPHFNNEKFVPEAYLYDKIDQEGLLKFVDKVIYICKYLPDGYTANMRKIIAENPKGYEAFIIQRLALNNYKKKKDLLLDIIRYIAISFILRKRNNEIFLSKTNKVVSILCFILGFIFYLKNYHKYKII